MRRRPVQTTCLRSPTTKRPRWRRRTGHPNSSGCVSSSRCAGLAVGAPVEFSGVNMGKVVSTQLDFDRTTRRFQSIVMVKVYPYRLGPVIEKLQKTEGNGNPRAAQFRRPGRAWGRAQARTGNLLTEQLYISFDFVKNAPKVPFDANATPLTLPTVPSTFDKLPEQIADIVDKINKLPLASIGKHVDSSLANLDATLKQVNGQLLPSTTRALDQANQTFGALRRASPRTARFRKT